MAAIDTSRPVVGLSAGRISNFVANMFANVADWNDARVTRNSLSQLSARELEDIGLIPGDIEKVARRVTR